MQNRRTFLATALATPAIVRTFPLGAQGPRKIRLAQPSAGLNYLPVFVAQELGFFQQEGIEAEGIVFEKGASSALTAVIGGDIEFYIGLPAIPLQARARGQKTKVFASVYKQWGSELILSPDKAPRAVNGRQPTAVKAAALKGLKIAVPGAGSITDLLVRHVAKFGGLDPDRDVTIIPIGGGANMLAAFAQRKIDGYCLSSPTSTIGIVNMGGTSLFDFADGEYEPLRDIVYTAVAARDEWIEANRDVAVGFARALSKGQAAMRERPDDTKAVMRKVFPRVDAAVLEKAWIQLLPGFGATLMTSDLGIQRNFDFLGDTRGTALNLPLHETFTNTIVEAARSSL